MLDQNQIKEFEDKFLAPYAMKSYQSRGRVHKEIEHPYRSAYQRDRDRIIHSAAFRRLEYKTQVFVNHEGDYYRTRLTHTLEVSQIARTIAAALKLNVDLVEAISLAHDLGHTPFGHSGEDALNEIMRKFGGFNHNSHGLRVVDKLEERYVDFPGINLTWEVREGIVRHSSRFDRPGTVREFQQDKMPLLETQVVDIADEIAYDNHDLDDGLTSGILNEADLEQLEIWNNIYAKISQKYGKIGFELKKFLIIRSLIDLQVTDLIREAEKKISRFKLKSWKQAKLIDEKIISFSAKTQSLRASLRKFLMDNLYHNWRVTRMSSKAKRFIAELFEVYIKDINQLPPQALKRISTDGKYQVVCDYIAAMTDRYASDEYKKLFDPDEKV